MSSTWWAGLSPATAIIDCGEHKHRLQWSDGKLQALDHPDAEGDRALAALGGDAYPCLAATETWRRHSDDLRILLLASRGPSDPVQPPDSSQMQGGRRGTRSSARGGRSGSGWFMYAPNSGVIRSPGPRQQLMSRRAMSMGVGAGGGAQSPADVDDIFGVAGLLSLGGGLTQRLCATVVAAWAQRIDADDEQARARHAELHAALYGRVACAVQAWLDDPNVSVDVVMSDGARSVTRSDDGYQVTLPFSWILDVWARGVSLFAGALCMGAIGDGDRLELQLVDLNLGRRTVLVSSA